MFFITSYNLCLQIIYLQNIYFNLIDYFDGFEFLYIFMTLYGFLYISLYLIFKRNSEFINLDSNKKLYVIKNIAKSIGLLLIIIYSLSTLYNGFLYDIWDNNSIHRIGFIYSSSDILSLLIVKKLPFSTKIHHYTVLFFVLISSTIDYTIDTYWRGLIIYTLFSCFSYLVNTYLGLRIIYNNKLTKLTCKMALYIYIICCFINWSYQIFIISKWLIKISPGSLLYGGLISLVVYDDIILIKFLKKNVYPPKNIIHL